MIPKFANPHSRSQDFELVSRAKLRSDEDDLADADSASDVEVMASKRKLHGLLLSEFGECLSAASSYSPRKKRRCEGNAATAPETEDSTICMYLSEKQPLMSASST
jgi:hypothetical protein